MPIERNESEPQQATELATFRPKSPSTEEHEAACAAKYGRPPIEHLRDVLAELSETKSLCEMLCEIGDAKTFGSLLSKRYPRKSLREALAELLQGDSGIGLHKLKLMRRKEAFILAAKMLLDAWQGDLDFDRLEGYARRANYSSRHKQLVTAARICPPITADPPILSGLDPRTLAKIEDDTIREAREDGEIDEQIRRLHDAGLTVEIIKAVREKYPDVAKARGLDKIELPAPPQAPPPAAPETGRAGELLPPGNLSRPMSKKELMTRLEIDSPHTFNTFSRGRIKEAGNRQTWQLVLDGLSEEQKAKLQQK